MAAGPAGAQPFQVWDPNRMPWVGQSCLGAFGGAAVVPVGLGRSWGPGWQIGAEKVHWAVRVMT